jgi:hypothetical protein
MPNSGQASDKSPSTQSKGFIAPFVSVYGRETRLDQIMKIKVKPVSKSKNECISSSI